MKDNIIKVSFDDNRKGESSTLCSEQLSLKTIPSSRYCSKEIVKRLSFNGKP